MLVVILGASPDPERYSNKAIKALKRHGHEVIPVSPGYESIEGIICLPSLGEIDSTNRPVDTLTLYVSPKRLEPMIPAIIALNPRRIIMNPGAESAPLAVAAKGAGIECEAACTLVLLSTGAF